MTTGTGTRPKLLLADDEEPILALLETTLRDDARYDILLAHDGAEALALWEAERPSIVVLDVKMPRIDGIDVCKALRSGHDQPLAIIMLSAMAQASDIARAMAAGANDYLTKPFSPSDLFSKVDSLLEAA